jgi:phosphoglycolate phosphatase-like HAD superfamily hydrolase
MPTYVFDLDGTLCSDSMGNYHSAQPFIERIKHVNILYDKGNVIIIQTARGMGSSRNSVEEATLKWKEFTEIQISDWGLKYHQIYFGKPSGDLYIDDKAINEKDYFSQNF